MKNIIRWLISKLEPIAYDRDTYQELEKKLQEKENSLEESELEKEYYIDILESLRIPYC